MKPSKPKTKRTEPGRPPTRAKHADAPGRFAAGNKGGRGGRREHSGRKPDAVRLAREAFFLGKADRADAIIDLALDPHDEAVPWEQKIKVAVWIKEGLYGKNPLRVEVAEDSAGHMLEAADAALVAAIAAEGADR